MDKRKTWTKVLSFLLAIPCMVTVMGSSVNAEENKEKVPYDSPEPINYKVEWHHPGKITKIQKDERELILYTTVKGNETKFYISFPNEGGFRMRTDLDGMFEPSGTKKITYTGLSPLTVTAGDTALLLKDEVDGWKITVRNKKGQTVLTVSNNQLSFGYVGNTLKKVKFEAAVSKDEKLYGTGERYNGLNQVGKKLQLWNCESAYHDNYNNKDYDPNNIVNHTLSYKNIPIIHSTRGYTIFFNSTYCCDADLAATNSNKYVLDFYGPKMDFYVWTGTTAQNIANYTSLTGRPFLAPKWAFGYWCGAGEGMWKNAEGGHVQKVLSMITNYKELGVLPAALGGEWYPAEDVTCYNILRKNGIKMLSWNYPNNQYNALGQTKTIDYYDEQPLERHSLSTWVKLNYIDYTHHNIVDYLTNFYTKYWDWGLRGCMLDFGEYIPNDALSENGMSGDEMHNLYAYYYAKAYYDSWKGYLGDDFITYERAACAGSQKYAANFTGDQASRFYGLKEQVHAIQSLSSCGFSIIGGDIGGVWGVPTSELYTRWVQFGAFSPLMRAHGSGIFRDPWEFGSDAQKMFVQSYCIRENLIDTVYSAAIRANKTGSMMAQSMAVAFPESEALLKSEEQYLFCNDFLVAPVTDSNKNSQTVELPKGTWYNFWNGETKVGGQKITVDAPLNQIPVMLREGTATPITLSADDLSLGGSMYEKDSVKALLVTPADTKRISKQYMDTDTEITYSNTRTDGGFVVQASSDNQSKVLVALGISAKKVVVDGKTVTSFSNRDSVTKKTGFYIDGGNRTVINIGKSDWKNVEIYGGTAALNLQGMKISDSANSDTVKYLIDGDIETSHSIKAVNGYDITLDLGKIHAVNMITMKWSMAGHPDSYNVEVSTDGENWIQYKNITDCAGGYEYLKNSPIDARYIRFSDFKQNSNGAMVLSEIEVQCSDMIGKFETNEFTESKEVTPLDDDEDDDNGGKLLRRVKKIIKQLKNGTRLGVWAIVGICAGAAVVLGGTVTFIILFVRKKRRKNQAQSI